jgi:hypothetical protein
MRYLWLFYMRKIQLIATRDDFPRGHSVRESVSLKMLSISALSFPNLDLHDHSPGERW